MELTGKLKDSVMNAKTKDEKKDFIEKAGMKLTDEELDMVSGGGSVGHGRALPAELEE